MTTDDSFGPIFDMGRDLIQSRMKTSHEEMTIEEEKKRENERKHKTNCALFMPLSSSNNDISGDDEDDVAV